MTEEELIRRARSGDARAFRELYDAHVERVFRVAYRMAGDEEVAREITQEVFVRAYTRLGQFRGEAAFSTWLHSVTTSTALNELRKRRRWADRERTLDGARVVASPATSSDPHLRERVRRAVEALPEIYRTVFLLHDVEGYNHGEIARTLDVAEGTSKARLSRARARLRDALADLAPEFA